MRKYWISVSRALSCFVVTELNSDGVTGITRPKMSAGQSRAESADAITITVSRDRSLEVLVGARLTKTITRHASADVVLDVDVGNAAYQKTSVFLPTI